MQTRKGSESTKKIRVLFVCLGNICRSPLAEGVFRHLLRERGLESYFEVDSAGTGAWHIGEPPDARMMQTALQRGVSLGDLRARQFGRHDFSRYDYIFVMDSNNQREVLRLDGEGVHAERVHLLRAFDPEPGDRQVPDPYYGGQRGFDSVFEMVKRTSEALLDHLVRHHRLPAT